MLYCSPSTVTRNDFYTHAITLSQPFRNAWVNRAHPLLWWVSFWKPQQPKYMKALKSPRSIAFYIKRDVKKLGSWSAWKLETERYFAAHEFALSYANKDNQLSIQKLTYKERQRDWAWDFTVKLACHCWCLISMFNENPVSQHWRPGS